MSDSVRPHRRQPTRLPRPWDSPGKNTGVGCHFLLQCMKVKSQSEVTQSCPTLSDPMDCSLPDSSIHGIFQARVLEWGAIAFSERVVIPSCKCHISPGNTVSFIIWNQIIILPYLQVLTDISCSCCGVNILCQWVREGRNLPSLLLYLNL